MSFQGASESFSMILTSSSDVRRLLVITYHFPPDGAIGGQRWAGLSKYLARLGWEVHVITASAQRPEQITPGVHRHVRRRRRTLNDLYKSVATRFRQTVKRNSHLAREKPERHSAAAPLGPLAAARRILGSLMDLPDSARGWVGRAAGGARSLLRERKFDVVITSGPPHSVHFAGMFATLGQETQFWIDMRDPWSFIHGLHAHDDWFVDAERFLLRRLERLVFPRAARVMVNTREFAEALRVAEPALDVTWFRNGIDLEQLPVRDLKTVERGSIAYVGTLYAGRNLSSVCAAMRQLLDDRPEAAAMLRLNVAGPIEGPHRRQLEDDIAAARLGSLVHIHGDLPRTQALEMLSRSHLALVLAQDQPLCVPAKLYESVGLGVPTLVIAEEMSASACEARRIGAMTLDPRDVGGVRSLLDALLDDRIPTRIEAKTPISYAALAVEMDRLLREMPEVAADTIDTPQAARTKAH